LLANGSSLRRTPKCKRESNTDSGRDLLASSSANCLSRRVVAKVEKQAQDFRTFPFHDLRHYPAVMWLKSGRSIYKRQQRLGHTSIKPTKVHGRETRAAS
jgi:integrase